MTIKRYLLICAAMGMALSSTASASTIALTFSGGSGFNQFQNVMAGWRFQTNSQITIDMLGVYDPGGVALAGARQVGIWDDVGTLLASTTVPASGGTLINNFSFANITAVTLTAGQLFTIA